MPRRRSGPLTALTLTAALAAGVPAVLVQGPADAVAARTPKSLVIGVDGATFDKFATAGMPNLDKLRRQGMTSRSNLYAEPMAPTLSGPGWSTIATGAWPDKHGVKDNTFAGNHFSAYPDYQTRIERAAPRQSTLVVGTWAPIADTLFPSTVDSRVQGGDDAGTTAEVADRLRHGDPDSTFVQLDEVDEAGHEHGAASPEYAQALREADQRIGRMVAAVEARPTYSQESWLIVVTDDHGHTDPGGHGGNSPQERGTFVIARGPGFTTGSTRHDVRQVDIAPTVLAHQGIARPASWGLDGTAIPLLRPDAFDPLRSSMRPAADETVPGQGWTRQAPPGWHVDNSRMPKGGTTEWRGWSFTTDEFWSNTGLGQGRETNVRSRDVFAVADSDEWDDQPHDVGAFDSTLVSSGYRVAGATRARLDFVTTYAVDGPQTADVLVSFDGRRPGLVRSYTEATNGPQRLDMTVPRGARRMQVRFHYTGENSAFWTIDQVAVSTR